MFEFASDTERAAHQAAFNKAVEGLRSQGFVRSINERGHCLFNGPALPDGRPTRCAVGWLCDVPEQFNSGFSGQDLQVIATEGYRGFYGDAEPVQHPELAPLIGLHPRFLSQLQDAHDLAYGPATDNSRLMWENLQDVGHRFGLDTSALGPPPVTAATAPVLAQEVA